MTEAAKEMAAWPEPSETDDAQIHALAWAMVEGVLDSQTARLTLLHAAAMLKATIAIDQDDPITAATEMLKEHAAAALDMTRAAMIQLGRDPAGQDDFDADFGHF